MGEFWQLFVKGYGGGRMALLITGMTVIGSLLEGINMSLLVPLLQSLESGNQGDVHWVTSAFANIFAAMGLPFGLNSILVTLAVLVSAIAFLKYLSFILAIRMNVGFGVWLSSRLMESFLRSDPSYFERQELGKLTNTLLNQVERGRGVLSGIIQIVAGIGVSGSFLVVAVMISPLLSAIALTIMFVVSISMQYFISKARSLGIRLVQTQGELQSASIETLSGFRFIKAYLLEPFRQGEFTKSATTAAQVIYETNRNNSQMTVVQELAVFGLIGSIVFVAVSIIGLDLAVIAALLFVLYRMAPRISNLNSLRQGLALSMASLHHVKETLDQTVAPKITSGEKVFGGLLKGIELQNVSFSYQGGPSVLEDASIFFDKGQMTALVGASGAGKSTIVDMILRFYDPVKGSLLVDGTDLREFDLDSWRRSIGVVSQDAFLFNETIFQNITMGNLGASVNDIEDAAKQAYAHDFILHLPEGYQTVVGDRGSNLSGGQRQRIALARAILRQPEILILDEATSALDSESEGLIQEYIRGIQGSCTILVVAHRMSTIQNANKIAVMEDGKMVEQGDWDSLLAENGVFATYHRLQIRSKW